MKHVPVLIDVVQKFCNLQEGDVAVDATLGLGGHAEAFLAKVGEAGKVIGFDQDERNLEQARERLKNYEKQTILIHDNFRYLKKRITGVGISQVDAILFDLGLSSPHLDEAERGFSFMQVGPLDMRFDGRNELTASQVVNEYPEEELKRIFYQYGEEKFGAKIARMICERRRDQKFGSTTELAEYIEKIIPKKRSKKASTAHPATKVFQAIRIEVNDELTVLEEALEQAFELLRPGGRLLVISYHSLEDRIVKRFMKSLQRPAVQSEEEKIYRNFGDPLIEILTKKPVIPTEEEIKENPRSRSAKLRVFEKL